MAKEVIENGGEGLPPGEAVELGLEHVLHVGVGDDRVIEDMDVDDLGGLCRGSYRT